MGESFNKRKSNPGGPGPAGKRSKGGKAGRWSTPSQQAKKAEKIELGTIIEPGDEGIWVTYARGMHYKCVREFKELCETYAKELWDIEPPSTESEEDNEDEEQDLEKALEKELSTMRSAQRPKTRQVFTPVSTGIECVFFMKTMQPVQPIALVTRICQDATKCADPMERKCRYVNRMTPVVSMARLSDKAIVKLARQLLAPDFALVEDTSEDAEPEEAKQEAGDDAKETYTYAIRHTIRNNSSLKSDGLIKPIAAQVDTRHKVNLANPDKVILVEVFQTVIGMSVADGHEWNALKRYNVNELYQQAFKTNKKDAKGEEAKKEETKEEAKEEEKQEST